MMYIFRLFPPFLLLSYNINTVMYTTDSPAQPIPTPPLPLLLFALQTLSVSIPVSQSLPLSISLSEQATAISAARDDERLRVISHQSVLQEVRGMKKEEVEDEEEEEEERKEFLKFSL